MMTAQEIIKKADLAMADLTANGGLLMPEQTNQFIAELIDAPTMLGQVRVVTMSSPKQKINKIGFGQRILHAAADGVPLNSGQRSKPTTRQIELDTKEVIAEVRLPYRVIEDQIMRGALNAQPNTAPGGVNSAFTSMLMTLIAERAALDLEELGLLGDTASGDPYLALVNGWLKRSSTNIVDMANAAISKTMFKNGVKSLPSQYLRNLTAMRHFVHTSQNIEYADKLADRETALGDSKIQQLAANFGSGVPVQGVALMPTTQGILTNPQNLIFGIQREITMETEKDISAREYKIVVTARIDFQVEDPLGTVKYTNILE